MMQGLFGGQNLDGQGPIPIQFHSESVKRAEFMMFHARPCVGSAISIIGQKLLKLCRASGLKQLPIRW